jgi:hypothetical protein
MMLFCMFRYLVNHFFKSWQEVMYWSSDGLGFFRVACEFVEVVSILFELQDNEINQWNNVYT